MRSRLSSLAALGAYGAALTLIWLSFSAYASSFTPVGRWFADTNDPADYRFVAEYFWGVPFRAATYDVIWHGGWGDYLRLIPFRSIGLGSFYLLTGWLRLGHTAAAQRSAPSYTVYRTQFTGPTVRHEAYDTLGRLTTYEVPGQPISSIPDAPMLPRCTRVTQYVYDRSGRLPRPPGPERVRRQPSAASTAAATSGQRSASAAI